jgi:hypothetical protein
VASSCNICVGVWRASAFFKQCVGHHKIVKCHLPWFSWSVLTCSSWLLGMCTQRHNNWNLLDIFSSHFFSLFFSSSTLTCQCIKVFYHFFHSIWYSFFLLLFILFFIFFYWFFSLILSLVIWFHLTFILSLVLILSIVVFFLFLIEFYFQFRSSIFDFNLFLCEIWSSFFLLLFIWFWILFIIIIFQFHPLTFIWLRILLR